MRVLRLSPVRREPRACSHTHRAPALMHRVLLVAAEDVCFCEIFQPKPLRMGHELRHEYVCTCHRTCRHMYIGRRTPHISHAHSARAPVLSLRRVLLQYMFDGAIALSDCNKIAIDASFSAATTTWPYSTWSSLTCS